MGVFDRIVCGVESASGAGLEALRQAKRLLAPGGRLVAATVHDPSLASRAAWHAPAIDAELAREAEAARAEAARELEGLPGAEAVLATGSPAQRLLALAAEEEATLLAVGTHGTSRAAGILLGTVATRLLHEAPCAVLVARPPRHGEGFPRRIVGGVDGSAESLAAAEVAVELADRLGAAVRMVAATGGKPVDVDGLQKVPRLEWDDRSPLEALVEASAGADLVVVGSRGLHGVAAIGSVSERVAHKAACSVLVVRG